MVFFIIKFILQQKLFGILIIKNKKELLKKKGIEKIIVIKLKLVKIIKYF